MPRAVKKCLCGSPYRADTSVCPICAYYARQGKDIWGVYVARGYVEVSTKLWVGVPKDKRGVCGRCGELVGHSRKKFCSVACGQAFHAALRREARRRRREKKSKD